jgi:predicted DNA-binding protein
VDKTTLYLSSDTHRRLRDASRRSGRAQALLIREAIERYLDDDEPPSPASIGMGADEEITGANSEEWLRENWRPR